MDATLIFAALAIVLLAGVIYWRRNKGKIRERANPIRVSESVGLYERNAFQVLGLNPVKITTLGMILQRRNTLQVLLEAGEPVQEHIPDYRRVAWPWAVQTSVDELTRAAGRIQFEPQRFEEEASWFHLDGEDEKVLESLSAGNLSFARSKWEERRAHGLSLYPPAQAAHNLAILSHAEVLAAERQKAEAGSIDADHATAWRNALKLWGEVHACGESRQYFKRRRSTATDPRLRSDEFWRDLCDKLPDRILRINLEIARAAHAQGNHRYARTHLEMIGSSPFPETAKKPFLDEFFSAKKSLLEELRATIKAINDLDVSLFNENSQKLKRWNTLMELVNLCNSLRITPDAWIREELREICDSFGKNKTKLDPIESELKHAADKAAEVRKVLEPLRRSCPEENIELRKGLDEDLAYARDGVAKVKEEIAKTREYLVSNHNIMRQQVDA